jgi:hypothetical protein
MRYPTWASAILLCALTGCGSGDPGQPGTVGRDETSAGASAPRREGNASAEEVAEELRGDVDCPARIKSPSRDAKAPVDDVLGVRPGLTYEEAANVVLCTNDLLIVQPDSRGFQIQTYGQTLRQGFTATFAKPRVEKSSKQIMQELQDEAMGRGGNRVTHDVLPGQSKWYVGTMGLPGQERVINVAREEWFEEGRSPTLASLEQALIKKYGTPTRNEKSPSQRYMTWAFDPLDRLITETSPLFNRCTGVSDPDGGANFSPDCGVVVTAMLFPQTDNPDLGRFFQVGIVDQTGGYEALTQTEQGLERMDAQRRAAQVEEASKNSNAPQL